MEQRIIRIGSRESALAVRQAEVIGDMLRRKYPKVQTKIITMKTTGDRILDKSLAKIGGKGLFVKELDLALEDGRIDIAVHSLKDMPMEENVLYPILAFGKREDPRDVLIFRKGVLTLPEHPVIGTSSRRRELQFRRLCRGCTFRGIRGNVQTRMEKLEREGFDATLLAAAGLKRLGMENVIGRYLSVEEMVPAAGQGILAVQGRKDDSFLIEAASELDDRSSHACALAERQFIRTVGGGCTSPSAAHAQTAGNELKLTGLYFDENTGTYRRQCICTDVENAQKAGEKLAEKMIKGQGDSEEWH